MGWFKTIQAKVIGCLCPINTNKLEKDGWIKIDDVSGPFGSFLSYKNWQTKDVTGKIGHRFILYPPDNNWINPKMWFLIDFSKDITHEVYNCKQLKSIIPNSYI